MRSSYSRRVRSSVLLAVVLVACQSGASLGATCARNDECGSPLVCRFGRCRSECAAQRDCPLGTTCLLDQSGAGSCALLDDPDCSTSAGMCEAPLACVGHACLNVCSVGPECPTGSACVPIGDGRARCVRTDGVDAGLTDDAGSDASQVDTGSDTGTDAGPTCSSPDCSGNAQLIVGDGWSCVRTMAGAVYCWGVATAVGRARDTTGCIARTATEAACATPAPLRVGPASASTPVTGVDTMDAQDTGGCYVASGAVYCWGTSEIEAPVGRSGPNDYLAGRVQLASGGVVVGQSAVFVTSGSAFAVDVSAGWLGWGRNYAGELLDVPAGTSQLLAIPIAALSIPANAELSFGAHHACALEGGAVRCWGANERGQVDAAAATPVPPRSVSLPGPATSISTGLAHSCALVVGEIYCWGAREAVLYGDALDASVPVDAGAAIANLPPTRVPTTSGGFAELVPVRNGGDVCAIDTTGLLWCWGQGYSGSATPAPVADLPPVRSAAVSWDHGCAITMAGEVWCWGLDDAGQRGQGTIVPSGAQPPMQVRW